MIFSVVTQLASDTSELWLDLEKGGGECLCVQHTCPTSNGLIEFGALHTCYPVCSLLISLSTMAHLIFIWN